MIFKHSFKQKFHTSKKVPGQTIWMKDIKREIFFTL